MSSYPRSAKKSDEQQRFLDQTLRPRTWEEYVGQKHIKENLRILLQAASERDHAPEHLLFYGAPGLGKTTLSHLIAYELGAQLRVTSGPAIERVGDLAAILTNLSPGDVLFIDEVHRLHKAIEEMLYPAMETGTLDIIIGKGPSARTLQLELPPFTLIAATTRIALLSGPLRSRFSGGTFKLDYYTVDEIETILARSAKLLAIAPRETALAHIAARSRRTPRTANYLLKRCRDYAQVHAAELTDATVQKALALLGIDEIGLTAVDTALLTSLADTFGGGPVGLGTLAAALSEDPATIEEVYEPFLMQIGFLERTSRGRVLTTHGFAHIGKKLPQQELLEN